MAAALKRPTWRRSRERCVFIGFTGHRSPLIHLKMLAYRYDWDAVQMPMNVMDPHYKSFQKHVLPILVKRRIGVIAMKTLGKPPRASSRRDER